MNKVTIPEGYKPSESEEYMNPMQLEYFRIKLNTWKNELLNNSSEALKHLQEENWHEPDLNDRANVEINAAFELKTQDRYRKLIEKIDSALERIENSEYGYCEETGEEIGVGRLEARPIATFSIDAQQNHENYERQHNEDE
ncbi:MAG: RNA polymerase-binding protein DksA [Rickettsiales bacterium]|jgi:DnaK suppressor protein|nr:RNA polymerase-binding protein DksA [Rickettsiales bacterium]